MSKQDNEEARQLLEAYQTTQTPGMAHLAALWAIQREQILMEAVIANREGNPQKSMVAIAKIDGFNLAMTVVNGVKVQHENQIQEQIDREKEVNAGDESY